ncbi:MAG TPA: hypothetical protein PLC89_25785 [Haliscomenobacter sp.]|uniref:Uncharacterized protein n=1 Tax=Haliscomenobacter hydrossis (strain ATCC 27775 / DSM 1100 / LMG 10767 / O) TaxID=760192 RepID=F4KRX6_HALH1|nr:MULTISPECIES: hypothetical protein [Haliscomenobacter]AEE51063.1 hypothetical protein Halhy_3202 [Haliscomenobacter hydrossis DSM 1100]HOY20750.1 hypothetical protein [Haliscomenobacter sp.]
MKHFFPFLFLFIMFLNVTIPLVEQLQVEDLYELAELGTDDADEEGKTETEKEKEKESISFAHQQAMGLYTFKLKKLRKSSFSTNNLPSSELYTSSPELPPEV